ncbi:MAG: hypothetical protein JSR76_00885, partial [Verrucomicrobia bacterium]|nr:hypothetical protein [Verrucomicrobiota bacterium]
MSLPPTPHLPRITPALRGYGPPPLPPSESSRGSATTTTVAAAVFDSLCLPHPPPIPRPQTAAATRLTPDGAPQPHPKPKANPLHRYALSVFGRSRGSVDSGSIIITGQPTASSPKCPLPTRLAPLILPSAYLREHASESGSTI